MARPRLARPNYRLDTNECGNWEIVWTENRRTRTLSTGTKSRPGAEAFLAQFLAGLDAPPPPKEPTIQVILDGYVKDRVEEGTRSQHTLKNSRNQICTILGHLKPHQISQATVKRYANERKLKRTGDGTIIRELGVLRAALKWAIRSEWIASAIDFLMPVKQPLPRARWLSRAEADRLLAACTTPHIRLFSLLAMSTGARKMAIAELTWDRVDLTRGIVDYGPGHGNKRRAVVPVTGMTLEELKAAYEVRTKEADNRVLEWGGKPAGDVKIAFQKACIRAGLCEPTGRVDKKGNPIMRSTVTPHILRHTTASWMVEAGIDSEEIARYLGTTKEMIEQVYGKHSPDYLRKAMKAVSF